MNSSSLCGRCALTFSIFKRKYRCVVCRLLFCTPCFKKGLNLPERNTKYCLKCHAFSSSPLKPSDLMLLSIKELKVFLNQNNVPTTGCKEKRDLVDVIMNHQRPVQPSSNSSSTPQSSSSSQSAQLGTSSTSYSESDSVLHDQSATASSNNSDSVFPLSEDILDSIVDRVLGYSGVRNESNTAVNTAVNPSSLHAVYVLNDDGVQEIEIEEEHVPSTANQDHSTPKPVPPENFEDSNEIKKLSVKELKAVLDKNYVDYKGCCEKDELIHRVSMLWQAKKSEENAPDETENVNGESDVCKVCMDQMVNCVLLECGHMMTCVECGRKLQECPMCRQNISRIVRVFKS